MGNGLDSTTGGTQAQRVLVIDDDEIVLESIRLLLAGAGYQVQCLASPIGATQVIMSQGIDAVVVDLNMPVMQGDRFISLLRTWDKIRDIPTILLSGATAETLHAVAKDLPGVAIVSKTTMHRALPETLRRVFARSRGTPAQSASASATTSNTTRRK